jgi:hypothetical protein
MFRKVAKTEVPFSLKSVLVTLVDLGIYLISLFEIAGLLLVALVALWTGDQRARIVTLTIADYTHIR